MRQSISFIYTKTTFYYNKFTHHQQLYYQLQISLTIFIPSQINPPQVILLISSLKLQIQFLKVINLIQIIQTNLNNPITQMETKQRILSVVGKNFDQITQIDNKIISIAVGQNHFIYLNSNQQTYGFGSNKFGQLTLNNTQLFTRNPVRILENISVKSLFCGAEHTFVINQKNEVFSCGLNIKGQLGHGTFENYFQPRLVVSLLPYGSKNPKTLTSSVMKSPTPTIIQALQKFDLQVKMQEQPNQKKFVLSKDEFIIQISCGALFSIALSNEGNIYGTGYQGLKSFQNHEDQLEKCRFRKIQVQEKIYRITTGLSGSVAISKDNKFYIWGKFGKHNINFPKRVTKDLVEKETSFVDCKLGDQFAVFLTQKGQIYTFGENYDNQLGVEVSTFGFRQKLQKVQKIPLMSEIFVGRNTVFCLSSQKNELYSWGSNKYGQLYSGNTFQLSCLPTASGIYLDANDSIFPSSYCTFFLTRKPVPLQQSKKPQQQSSTTTVSNNKQSQSNEPTIPVSQYIKLMQQYRALKALNLTMLQKIQPTVKKNTLQTQTYFRFELEGVTEYRKFNSNIQLKWGELQLESQINEGGFGLIYRAKWREITVIVKKFKIENGDVSIKDFLSECHAMEAVRHPHIVMFLGAVTTHPHYSIVLEYCSKGSLWSYLQNPQNNISWEDKRRFAIEIAQGVLYLHLCSPPILHRDLKSLNIFIDGDLKIKIGDFGWTKTLQNYMTNKIGTYQWMAPQVIGNKPYTEKADVFSFSIIMWEIASRQPPYKNISGTKVSEDVLHKELRPQIPKKTPQPWAKLMKRCWDKDPSKRPDFTEITKEFTIMKLTEK